MFCFAELGFFNILLLSFIQLTLFIIILFLISLLELKLFSFLLLLNIFGLTILATFCEFESLLLLLLPLPLIFGRFILNISVDFKLFPFLANSSDLFE